MILLEILDFVERFQTILVGAGGIVGVMWTLRSNAQNAIKEHQRQLDTKRLTLRRILAAEFRNYSYALRANIHTKIPDNELFSVGKVHRTLSESLATDLGLLELGEIDVTVNAIISLDGMNHFLENLSLEQSETRFLIPAAALDEFRAAALTTADALDLAVQALELATDL